MKIKNIKFNNFRAFKGEVNFDFITNDSVADFICIYGPNGMGKSSFFDGVEWFFNDKIHRIENEPNKKTKNKDGSVDNKVLSNFFGNTKGSVSVLFDDENKVDEKFKNVFTKEVKISKKTSVDYIEMTKAQKNKMYKLDNGSVHGELEFWNNKQLLPHSQIDAYFSNTNARQRYSDWTSQLDIEQQEIGDTFKKLVSVTKKLKDNQESLRNETNRIIKDINDLNIDDKDIVEINKIIDKLNDFNSYINFSNVKLLNVKRENNIYTYPKTDDVREYQNNLIKKITQINSDFEKIDKEIKNYIDIDEVINELTKTKNYLEMVRSDFDLVIKNENILEEIQLTKFKYNKIVALSNDDNLNNLNNYNNKLVKKSNLDIKLKEIEKEIKKEEEEIYKSEAGLVNNNRLKTSLRDLKDLKKYLVESNIDTSAPFLSIEKNRTELRELLELTNNNLKILKYKKDEYKKLIDTVNLICNEIGSEQNTNDVLKNLNIVLTSKNKLELDLYDGGRLEQLNTKINVLNKNLTEKSELDEKYKRYSEFITPIEKSKNLVRDYVDANNTSICPVCHTDFESVEYLLERINTNIIDSEIKQIQERIKILDSEQKKLIKEIKDLCHYINNLLYKEIDELNIKSIQDKCILLENDIQEQEKIKSRLNDAIKKYITEFNIIKIENELNLSKIINDSEKKLQESDKEYYDLKLAAEEKKTSNTLLYSSYEKERTDLINELADYEKNNKELLNICTEYSGMNLKEISKSLQNRIESFEKNYKQLIETEIRIKNITMDFSEVSNKLKSITKDIDVYENKKQELVTIKQNYSNKECDKISTITIEDLKITSIEINNKRTQCIDAQNLLSSKIDFMKDLVEKIFYSNKDKKELEDKKNKKAKEFEEHNQVIRRNEAFIDKYKKYISDEFSKMNTNSNMRTIYSLIEPYKEFMDMQYSIKLDKDDNLELYIEFENEHHKTMMPDIYFSSAQLNTLALSMFLGEILSIKDLELKTIFIDDPIGHFDDVNILAFIDLVRCLVDDLNYQVVLSTHDIRIFNLMQIKLDKKYYNSKFIQFKSIGEIEVV